MPLVGCCTRNVIRVVLSEPVYAGGGGRAWSPLGSEAALREAASLPLSRWRAPAILAWLELALGMPQYAAAVADNVKSGKVGIYTKFYITTKILSDINFTYTRTYHHRIYTLRN